MSRYSINKQRLVRNPITGEEVAYPLTIATPRESINQEKPINNSDLKLNEFLSSKKPTETTVTQFGSKSSTINSSLVANVSRIPLLDFKEMLDDEMKLFKKIEPQQEKQQASHLDAERSAKLPSTKQAEKNEPMTAKSAYQHGFNSSRQPMTPLLKYQNQIESSKPLDLLRDEEEKKSESLIAQLIKPATQKKDSLYKIERVADLEKLWLNNVLLSQRNQIDASSAETAVADKNKQSKEKLVLDTVLNDQLSHFDFGSNAGQVTSRRLNVNGTVNENILSKRCKFNCRIVSPNGKLALKELFGIFFLHDGSLTVYEFRLLCGAAFSGLGCANQSKKANALPFINRRVHVHAQGRRKGEHVELFDLRKEAVIGFSLQANELPSMNAFFKQMTHIELEITDVDEAEKAKLTQFLQSQLNESNMQRANKLENPHKDLEKSDEKIIASVRAFMRKQIEQRSVEVYMGLCSWLKKNAKEFESSSGLGLVNQQQFYEALLEYNIQIHSEDLNIVWQVIDLDATGLVTYYKLMRVYFGEMNAHRHAFFRSVLLKLDTQKTGYVQVNDVYKYYMAKAHPKVKSGDYTETKIFEKFLDTFELIDPMRVKSFSDYNAFINAKSKLISYEQLEEYYNGLSVCIDADADFIQILKNSWNLN